MNELSFTFHDLAIRLMARLETTKERGRSGPGRVVYITSATHGEGKSFVARALANHVASVGGNRIALVDANFENPWGKSDGAPGLSDWLVSGEPMAPAMTSSDLQNLSVLPAGRQCMAGLGYRREAVAGVLANLVARHDLVFVDGGGLDGAGANSFLYQSDGVLLIVDGSSSRREVVQHSIADLSIDPSRFMGVILNKRIRYIPRFIYERV